MKKSRRMISFILLIITILSTILPVVFDLSKVFARTYEIQYNGKIKYGYSTVGDFTVNGVRAFCIDHSKPTPPTRRNYC